MTRLLQLLIFLLTADYCFAQVDSVATKKNIWGVNIGSIASSGSEGFNYYVYGTVEKGKHLVALGPVVGPKLKIPSYGVQIKEDLSLTGAHIVYQLNPNPTSKRFNFFFEYDFIFLYHADKGTDKFVSYGSVVGYSYNSHRTTFENYIGYGFKVKFLKHFYLNQSVGVGLLYTSTLIDYYDIADRKDSGFDPAFMGKLGLGYRFDK